MPLSSPLFSDGSAYSEMSSYSSECTPSSSLSFSCSPLSPTTPSPRSSRTEALRGGCPSRATSTSRTRVRVAPYTLDGRHRRSSTLSSVSRPRIPKSDFASLPSPSTKSAQMNPLTCWLQSKPITSVSQNSQTQQALLPSNFPNNSGIAHPVPLTSQGKSIVSQSDDERRIHRLEHYFDFPGPPDLLGPLKEEPSYPPPEDMKPQDPNMVPKEQELRFQDDLYTPRWVRGQGNKREGWCGICKPGRWLVLKNSAFWYDKCFTHGICAATGRAFMSPKDMRRIHGNSNAWEGLCGICGQWVSLVSSKKKGTTWFRHAYKVCQRPPGYLTLVPFPVQLLR
ncbi:hypothetical protein VTO42DRAFT_20 [Malbranchea cinnamomea]